MAQRNSVLAVAIFLTFPTSAYAEAQSKGVPAGYSLVWHDEFDTDGLPDPKNWRYDTYANKLKWWHNELQYYTEKRLENSRVMSGNLVIEARKEDMSKMPDNAGQQYSSTRLISKGKVDWTYGYFDVRAKVPCGKGPWPAVWTMGYGQWPQTGEIDIVEVVGQEPTTVHGTVHTVEGEFKKLQLGSRIDVPDLCHAFHNFQTEWTPSEVALFVDGQRYYTFNKPQKPNRDNWPFTTPHFILINIAVGGWGGQKGIDADAFPAQLLVDYVRVYQKK